jgi:hemerythrin-like domain-containing protein
MTKRKALKRHESLQPLSRHHMIGLHTGLKLSRAGTEESRISYEEILADAKAFWEPDGQAHFREEEEILLPAFATYGDINQPEIIEMLLEHVTIRSQMDLLLKGKCSLEETRQLGVLLQNHIRKEERIIFPMIEQALPEEKLIELAPYLHGD